MSSNSSRVTQGAAEEPGPEPDDASSTGAAASYDPADYQKPHPDDRGGGGGGDGKKKGGATKPRGKAKAAATDKAKDKGKAKEGKATGRCGNCDAEGAVLRCGQCGTEVYCGEACQRVSGGRVR